MKDFVLINKPVSWTSFDVVAYIRNRIRATSSENSKIKVGHAGTLDPFASGLLIVGIGREATKRIDEFKVLPKTYIATIELGAVSDTLDSTGNIIQKAVPESERPDFEMIERLTKKFVGKQFQVPPMYSAKKVSGKRLYMLARQGEEIKRDPVEIEIYNLKIIDYTWPILKIEVTCSAGTYIRTLADDLGRKLGVGAFCKELIRTAIGDYHVQESVSPKDFLL